MTPPEILTLIGQTAEAGTVPLLVLVSILYAMRNRQEPPPPPASTGPTRTATAGDIAALQQQIVDLQLAITNRLTAVETEIDHLKETPARRRS